MNIKRFLKQQSRHDQKSILDADNAQTLHALGVECLSTSKKTRCIRGWLTGAASATATIIIFVCIFIFYLFPSSAPSQTLYWDTNFESRPSEVNELNREMHDFTFTIDETIYSTRITRTSDNVSGDVLYYRISLTSYDALLKMELVVVCNVNFHYSAFDFDVSPDVKDLPEYSIMYSFVPLFDEQFGLDSLSASAEIDGLQDIVYIVQYKELLIESKTNFFNVIQKLVQPIP